MLSDQVIDLLTAARQRITDPKHWTMLVTARDAAGFRRPPTSPEAVCWCAIGAIVAELYIKHPPVNVSCFLTPKAVRVRNTVVSVLTRSMGDDTIGDFNDTHTHEEVLAAFDRAIILVKEV